MLPVWLQVNRRFWQRGSYWLPSNSPTNSPPSPAACVSSVPYASAQLPQPSEHRIACISKGSLELSCYSYFRNNYWVASLWVVTPLSLCPGAHVQNKQYPTILLWSSFRNKSKALCFQCPCGSRVCLGYSYLTWNIKGTILLVLFICYLLLCNKWPQNLAFKQTFIMPQSFWGPEITPIIVYWSHRPTPVQ